MCDAMLSPSSLSNLRRRKLSVLLWLRLPGVWDDGKEDRQSDKADAMDVTAEYEQIMNNTILQKKNEIRHLKQ